MVPQRYHLQHALCGEDNDEHQVDQEQDLILLLALIVRFHHHGHHVEADQNHDEDVKELLRYEVKHHTLDLVLQSRVAQGKRGGYICMMSLVLFGLFLVQSIGASSSRHGLSCILL